MRAAYLVAVLAACSVPDKQAAIPDNGGGSDAGSDAPIDNTIPETSIDEAPDAFSRVGQPTFRFSSTDPRATFQCRIDTELAQPCTSPYVRTLADGPHSFSVRASDPSGLSDDSPAEMVWTIDTVAPNTTLTMAPPSADNSVMAKFSFTSNEMNALFDCSLDNGGYVQCTSGASFGPVNDGTHAFAVRARDRAGNLDPSPAVFAWTVNTSTPDTTILTGPKLASTSADATFTFVSQDAGAGATFACSLDGAALSACSSPQVYNGMPEGDHTFTVRVKDAVGNVDPSPATYAWTIDRTAPQTTITAGPSGTLPAAVASVSFTADETNVTYMCSLDGAAYAGCTSPAALTGLAQGAHSFAVRATDAAGNTDASPATASWSVDTTTPTLMITSGPADGAMVGPRVVIAFTASEGTTTCSYDGAAFTACSGALATNLPAGDHTFTVKATDAAGNGATAMRSFTVACAPPAATGAVGQLHLDTASQTQDNAVAGGAAATLGDSAAVGDGDPTATTGRFAGGLAFAPADSAHVTWPLAAGPATAFALELWAKPNAPSGARDLAVTDDGRIALRVTAATATTVRFTISVVEGGAGGTTRSQVSAAVAAGAWHHVLVSMQDGSLQLWTDGVKAENTAVMLGAPLALDGLRLGGNAATAYDGALDEVWLASQAIDSDDAALGRYCPL